MVWILQQLGFLLNLDKSSLVLAQEFTYLSLRWNTVTWEFRLTEEQEAGLCWTAEEIIDKGLVKGRLVVRMIGRVQSAVGVVPLARARIMMTQWEFLVSCKKDEDYDSYIWLSEEAQEELEHWKSLDSRLSSAITLLWSFHWILMLVAKLSECTSKEFYFQSQ